MANYEREDKYDLEKIEQLKYHYREVLRLLGEDPEREGLIKTPERVAKAWSYLTKGYDQDPAVGNVQGGLQADGCGQGYRTLLGL